jgi:hypothetical protein
MLHTALKNALTGAALGIGYTVLQSRLQTKKAYSFNTSHPYLASDQHLADVLDRFSSLRECDEEKHAKMLASANELLYFANNPAAQASQFKSYRLAVKVTQCCDELCAAARKTKNADLVQDAVALSLEIPYVRRLCDNHVHNIALT